MELKDPNWADARTQMEQRFVVAEQALSSLDEVHALLLKTMQVLGSAGLAVFEMNLTLEQLKEARSQLEQLATDALECAQFWDTEREPGKEEQSWVYFIGEPTTGNVKIGFSKNVLQRLAQLQTAATSQLQLLGCTAGGPRLEKTLHEQFKLLRVRGEWFRLGPELVRFIQEHCTQPGNS